MRQIVHKAHLRATLQDCGNVYLLDIAAAARHAQQRHHLKLRGPFDQITAALRLQKSEHQVHSARFELMRVLEHLVAFANAGSISQVDFQVASAFLMTHDGTHDLVRKHSNVDASRSTQQAAHGASEYSRSQILLYAVSNENLRHAVRTRVSQNGLDGVFALKYFHLRSALVRLRQSLF